MYMLQRQYNIYIYMRRGANIYMLQRHIVHVAKTYLICCEDIYYMLQRQKSTVLGLSAPAGAFFLPERDILISENTYSCFCVRSRQDTS